ncbi:MAG: hypothetical protein HYY49_07385 [Ignavibacteriales bacterium]|nr:hypothetical protein [Ignavibacteriales bacterium]
MKYFQMLIMAALFVSIFATLFGQESKNSAFTVPTVITNHYDKSQIKSHGVVTVFPAEEVVRIGVRDLAKNTAYDVVLLDESSGDRSKIGSFKTDGKGGASGDYSAKGKLKSFNALLIVDGEDVVQYAQLQGSHHGCICKHSGGTIVTRKLDQECFECPCGVK